MLNFNQHSTLGTMCFLDLTTENIHEQHICCGFSDKKCSQGYSNKKDWLSNRFNENYNFTKLDVRGKVFIEYGPIEQCWLPLKGENFTVINCFWVSGKFKGQGYGKKLLQDCIEKSKGKDGVVIVASNKKRPFMSDPKFLKSQGFQIVDEAPPFFTLWGLKWNDHAEFPEFLDSARAGSSPIKEGIHVYYSDMCPFNDYYINQHTVEYAKSKGIPITIDHIDSREKARNLPVPWSICTVFYNGELVTVEMKPDRHLDKLLQNVSNN